MRAFADNKFVIYGVGIKTEKLINAFGNQVAGLMEQSKTGETIYGKRVLSKPEILQSSVKTIVIAARQANVPIIYRRISGFCKENSITVYDAEGNKIGEQQAGGTLDFGIVNITKLREAIDAADVVSFDVFDTLILRECLYPDDVFEIAGTNNVIEGYERIFAVEYKLARPRKEAVSLYEYAVYQNKEVYFVSDMYLKSGHIEKLLRKCKIKAKENRIFVSSEHGVDKVNGLFDVLKRKCGSNKRIIHIGDSYEADYLAAKEYGINTVMLTNRLEILEHSGNADILQFDALLANRLVIGNLLASGLTLADFISPLLYKFVAWIKEESKKFDLILLGARDGWLINLIRRRFPQYDFPAQYFLTSRTAAVSAGVFKSEDIEAVKKYPFSGEEGALYERRFAADAVITNEELLMHTEKIRRNYLRYVDSLKIPKDARVGFVDFVSAGTCYRALKKFLNFEISGLFAVNLGDSSRDIETLYSEGEQTAIIKNYFLIEEAICSGEPTLKYFDDNGGPVFFKEKRTDAQLGGLYKLQSEILKYGERTADIDFNKVDLKLCDRIFGMTKESALSAEDEFCGR